MYCPDFAIYGTKTAEAKAQKAGQTISNDALQAYRDQLKAAQDQFIKDAQNAGVNATPTFFVNGYPLSGAASYEQFKEVVDTALEQAQSAQRTN